MNGLMKKNKKAKKKKLNFDVCLGCPAYPMCDEDPYGCVVYAKRTRSKIEWRGHKD